MFYNIIGIELLTAKTRLQVHHGSTDPIEQSFTINNQIVTRTPRNVENRVLVVLGVFVNVSGGQTTQEDTITHFFNTAVGFLQSSAITDQQCLYFINNVILPAVLYKCMLLIPASGFLESIDIKLRTLFKQKAGKPRSFPSDLLNIKALNGLKSIITLFTFTRLIASTRNGPFFIITSLY